MVSSLKAEPQNVVLRTNDTRSGFFFARASNSRDFFLHGPPIASAIEFYIILHQKIAETVY